MERRAARDAMGVVAWPNLLAAYPGMWGDYLAPLKKGSRPRIPDDVRTVTVSGTRSRSTSPRAVNPTSFTFSELSQITPLPQSWDLYEPSTLACSRPGRAASRATTALHWRDLVGGLLLHPLDRRREPRAVDGLRRPVRHSHRRHLGERHRGGAVRRRSTCFAHSRSTRLTTRRRDRHRCDVGAERRPVAAASLQRDRRDRDGAEPGRRRVGTAPAASLLSFVPCSSWPGAWRCSPTRWWTRATLPIAPGAARHLTRAVPSHDPLSPRSGYRESVLAPWSTSYFTTSLAARGGRPRRQCSRSPTSAWRSSPWSTRPRSRGPGRLRGRDHRPGPDVAGHVVRDDGRQPRALQRRRAAALLTSHGWHLAPGKLITCATPAKCGPGITGGRRCDSLSSSRLVAPPPRSSTRSA